jgi:hypothetical protein
MDHPTMYDENIVHDVQFQTLVDPIPSSSNIAYHSEEMLRTNVYLASISQFRLLSNGPRTPGCEPRGDDPRPHEMMT